MELLTIISLVGSLAIGAFIGYMFGESKGWHRRGQFEPTRSIELMEAENKMIRTLADQQQAHLESVYKAMGDTQGAIDAGMHRTIMERDMLRNGCTRKFFMTCDKMMMHYQDAIRRGPWTEDQANKFIGSVLDAVYDRKMTIAEAVTKIWERFYFDPMPHKASDTTKVPVQQV